MIYSVHTFEITLYLDTEKFGKLKNRAYEKAKRRHKIYHDDKKIGVYHDHALIDKGIKIEYHDGTYKKKIKFIVNPTYMLGGDDVKKLWKTNDKNISKLLRKLDAYTVDYFDSKYNLNYFKLTRMDFTVNIDVGNNKTVGDYIKVLRNIGKVKGFKPKYGKYDEDTPFDYDPNHSFDLKGNSNGIDFTAYDKEADLRKKIGDKGRAKGILRVEVRLMKSEAIQKTLRRYADDVSTTEQIGHLASNSQDIFLSIFEHIVPRGDYYKKKDAMKIIEDKIPKKSHREKMLRLLELIPAKKSLYFAVKEMGDRNIYKVAKAFEDINVSPVTISKRHDIKKLDSLYNYM